MLKFRNRYLQQMSKLYNYNRNIIKISMNILGAHIEQYKIHHRKIGKNVNWKKKKNMLIPIIIWEQKRSTFSNQRTVK